MISIPRLGLAALVSAVMACRSGDPGGRDATVATGDVSTAIPVRLAPVTDDSAAQPVTATGVIALRDEVTLSFKVGGVIAQVLVREGATVRAGQLLATLDLREIDAQVAKARSAAAKADRDLARVARLYKDSVATRQQMDDATTGAEVAHADLQTAAVNQQYARIVAPSAGVILRRAAEPGELVSTGAPVLTLGSRTSGTIMRASLPDRDVVRLVVGDRATVRVDARPDRTFQGVVRQIGAAADPRTGTYAAEVALDAPEGLSAGMIGRVEIATRSGNRLRAVPVEALLEADGDHATLYAIGPDGRAKRVPVEVAFMRGDRATVRGGLTGVTRVVTDGAPYLNDGSAVRVLP